MSAPIGSFDWAACDDCANYDADIGCCIDDQEREDAINIRLDRDEIRCGCWVKE